MNRRTSVVAAVLVVGTALGTLAAATTELICPRADRPPIVDGMLGDPCWQKATAAGDFTQPLEDQAPAKAVEARVCFDATALYLALSCHEPSPASIRAVAKPGSRDVWKDDCVEVWIKADDGGLGADQFIVNAAGVRQAEPADRTDPGATAPDWQAKAGIGADRWTVEMAIPFAALKLGAPKPGTMLQIKFGREDHAGDGQRLAVWPPKSGYGGTEGYGALYFERANLLANPDMSQVHDGKVEGWGFGANGADRELFSSVDEAGRKVIRFAVPDRYAVAQQGLSLRPNSVYRLSAAAKGGAGIYLRARTAERKGMATTAYTVQTRAAAEYRPVEVTFPSGETGEALIVIGGTQGSGQGEVCVAGLCVRQVVAADADGPAIPLAAGAPLHVRKAPVADCRALRGFVVAPVDGRLDSWNWNMTTWEYGMRDAGAGVGYRYRHNDGLHITLADDQGVDAVQIRKGVRVKLYRDVERCDDPGKAPLLWEFRGQATVSHALFGERVKARRFSFFDLQDGLLADATFLRVDPDVPTAADRLGTPLAATARADSATLPLAERFAESERVVYALGTGAAVPLRLEANRLVHLVAATVTAGEMALDGVRVELRAPQVPAGCPLTLVVQDPLSPRQELMRADFVVKPPGALGVFLDFPDQVLPAGSTLWLSLAAGVATTIDAVTVRTVTVPRAQALPEAVAFRKLMMRGLFCMLSEARPWNGFRPTTDLEQFYRENHWGTGVRDLAAAIALCKSLAPDDPVVQCYDAWFWRGQRRPALPPPQIEAVAGAPEWAVLARQAWLESRSVAQWWLDNRLVPTGEFGGQVGDDSDMYQNYADLPMLEDDGVAAQAKAGAAALAELAEAETMDHGLNRRTMDPLHAYEEGINHESLMLWWNYGDPVYFERCLQAAKSMPALTTVTASGHRHFRNQECGAEDLRIDRALGVDGGAHPLMLQPCFEVAWYNGNPRVLKFVREWGDGWAEHLKDDKGGWPASVDVKTEQVTERVNRPFNGGYGGQGTALNFLYRLTGEAKYIGAIMGCFAKGETPSPARNYLPELWQFGSFDGVATAKVALDANPVTLAIVGDDMSKLFDALRNDIAEIQKFRTMYTDAEVFTDRVFLSPLSNATLCYTGGYATRNKYNHSHAVSWAGFGTEYAALVKVARRDRFQCLLYNFREAPVTGTARFWTLEHGRYRVALGPDSAGEFKPGEPQEIVRGAALPVTLPVKTVVRLELTQVEELDDLPRRPDLALCAREVNVADGAVSAIVHNIGGGDAPAFTVVLQDAQGATVATQTLGPLPAPVDLEPKRLPFRFAIGARSMQGCRLVVDAGNVIPELCEENNGVPLQ